MKRRLLGASLWLVIVLSLTGTAYTMRYLGLAAAPPAYLANWMVLISWSPFVFMMAMWIAISLAIRSAATSGPGKEAPMSAQDRSSVQCRACSR